MTDSETTFTPPLIDAKLHMQKLSDLGLQEAIVGGRRVYTVELMEQHPTEESPNSELLRKLKETLKGKKVAVELGPTNDLSSLSYAAKRADADVVIGIDPNFDFDRTSEATPSAQDRTEIILLKGDGWGDKRIWNFFGDSDKKESRLASYAQLVNPDSDEVERMMRATIPKSSQDFLVVLDSGALEILRSRKLPQTDVKYGLLKEAGFEEPTDLDWIRHVYRKTKITEIDSESYRRGMENGTYPPTSFLRHGDMLIFENQPQS